MMTWQAALGNAACIRPALVGVCDQSVMSDSDISESWLLECSRQFAGLQLISDCVTSLVFSPRCRACQNLTFSTWAEMPNRCSA